MEGETVRRNRASLQLRHVLSDIEGLHLQSHGGVHDPFGHDDDEFEPRFFDDQIAALSGGYADTD